MAYNNYFPIGYQSYYPQQMQQSQQPQQQMNSSIIWVQGEAGAKSYLVAPNNTVQLWDSERQTIYLKSADASGMPSMRILDYTIRQEALNSSNVSAQSINPTEVSKKDLEALQNQIDVLKEKIASITNIKSEAEHE